MYPRVRGVVIRGDFLSATEQATLSRGLGRSYGDASLPADIESPVASSLSANRLLTFDASTGVVRAQAGMTLLDLNRLLLPRGWFTPVSPGTQFVTLGGMVAADVHGKNHHVRGSFGEHVRSLRMRVADGRVLDCSDHIEPELFRATLGGMGLPGPLRAVRLPMEAVPPPLRPAGSRRYTSLEAVLGALLEGSRSWPYTVAWVDCLQRGAPIGRGIVTSGRWADRTEAPRRSMRPRRGIAVPFMLPGWVLGKHGMRTFNRVYFGKHGHRVRRDVVHPEAFFYPLDTLRHWNRVYGRRGFTQYQCVLPGETACRRLFETFAAKQGACFLCVIKDFGAQGQGLISFPQPGISIPPDTPIRATETQDPRAPGNGVACAAGRAFGAGSGGNLGPAYSLRAGLARNPSIAQRLRSEGWAALVRLGMRLCL